MLYFTCVKYCGQHITVQYSSSHVQGDLEATEWVDVAIVTHYVYLDRPQSNTQFSSRWLFPSSERLLPKIPHFYVDTNFSENKIIGF